jgi:hypothetical protein
MQIKLTVAFALILTFGMSEPALAQSAVVVVPTGPIPKGFRTYSLFLICNPKWLNPGNDADLLELYNQFQIFGDAIGNDNAAVWFRQPGNDKHSNAFLPTGVDVARSVRFCQAWKLKPSEGPHIVIMSTYPDEAHLTSGLPREHALYKLGKMAPNAIFKLLADLTDQLVVNGKVDPATNEASSTADPPTTAPPAALWVRLLSATQQTLDKFGCAWSFKVSAGPVSADLKACGTT